MSWNNLNETGDGFTEKGFTLSGKNGDIPGVYFAPPAGAERLVLLGHGGTTHKKAEYIMHVAGLLAAKGIASMAIDGPGHGDRFDNSIPEGPDQFLQMWEGGGGHDGMVNDWHMALDFMESEFGARPTGWWGLSMGTMMGLPVCATDSRIKVAQLGLMGTWGPNGDRLRELAPELTCPIRFLVQWDDEVVPRDRCLELYDLIGSKKKTLHANPGLHSAVPVSEIRGSTEYLDRFLK